MDTPVGVDILTLVWCALDHVCICGRESSQRADNTCKITDGSHGLSFVSQLLVHIHGVLRSCILHASILAIVGQLPNKRWIALHIFKCWYRHWGLRCWYHDAGHGQILVPQLGEPRTFGTRPSLDDSSSLRYSGLVSLRVPGSLWLGFRRYASHDSGSSG